MNPQYKIYQEKSKRKSSEHKNDIDLGDIMYYNNIIIRIMRRIKILLYNNCKGGKLLWTTWKELNGGIR